MPTASGDAWRSRWSASASSASSTGRSSCATVARTEAARSVIEHAFTALGATALFAGHPPQNAPSRRTLQKLGFRYTHHEPHAPSGLDHPAYLLCREAA